jgi:hypothetical protein
MKIFADFGPLDAVGLRLLCECFMFINGAVVEVPQSGQLSLYSTSLRPHFRQNGIFSSPAFKKHDSWQPLKV